MVMITNKLQPIYVALDNHQYNRAIKLCLAQSEPNCLCQALLIHSYAKAGQRYKAVLTIQRLLPESVRNDLFFPELAEELKNLSLLESTDEIGVAGPPAAGITAAKKMSKKGKKKSSSNSVMSGHIAVKNQINSPQSCKTSYQEGWDIIDQLDTPSFPQENWDSTEIGQPLESSMLDPTFLSTLSTTMINHLKLPLTAYQLYCWAAFSSRNYNGINEEIFLRKAYVTGLVVLLSPQYRTIAPALLSNLQNLALNLSRLNSSCKNSPIHMWAAQTALWQIEFGVAPIDEKNKTRFHLLPRLAESLARKFVDKISEDEDIVSAQDVDISLVATESFLLYIRSLDIQANFKLEEKLEAIQAKLSKFGSSCSEGPHNFLFPPRPSLLKMKVNVLQQLGNFRDARTTLEELIGSYPDDWIYWKSYLECAIAETGDVYAGCKVTNELVSSMTSENTRSTNESLPCRSLRWIEMESLSKKIHVSSPEWYQSASNCLDDFVDSLKRYGDDFAKVSAAAFSDICPYIDSCLEIGSVEYTLSLLEWAKSMRIKPVSEDIKDRCAELRMYIFAVQINHKILSKYRELWHDHMPSWEELIEVCHTFRTFETKCLLDRVSISLRCIVVYSNLIP
jgi:tetratricopeptide (TPR) repeat protein